MGDAVVPVGDPVGYPVGDPVGEGVGGKHITHMDAKGLSKFPKSKAVPVAAHTPGPASCTAAFRQSPAADELHTCCSPAQSYFR